MSSHANFENPRFFGRLVSNAIRPIYDCIFWEIPIHKLQHIWGFPKMGVPQNGWFIRENPIKMDDDWGYPYFRKPRYINWSFDVSSVPGFILKRLHPQVSLMILADISTFSDKAFNHYFFWLRWGMSKKHPKDMSDKVHMGLSEN